MKLLKSIYRKTFFAVAFAVILKIFLCSSICLAYSENHNEYLNLSSEIHQSGVPQGIASENILQVKARDTSPLSVISVPVPPPAIIILTSTGAFIVKSLRRRGIRT